MRESFTPEQLAAVKAWYDHAAVGGQVRIENLDTIFLEGYFTLNELRQLVDILAANPSY